MKKIILTSLLLICGLIKMAKATDPTVVAIGNQFQLSLLSHVTAVGERDIKGTDRLEFLDGIAQIGHYKGDYILAIDAGFLDSTAPDSNGQYKMTYGAHLHALEAILGSLPITLSPTVQTLMNDLELSPRWSYDTDVHHGVFGVTFGAVIPFN